MEVKAYARKIRMSPTKVRLVVDVVRGMHVGEAKKQLMFMKKAAAVPVAKLLDSAVANAQHNFKLDAASLYIKRIAVDEGVTLKRWRARAFGRGAAIRKRAAHIMIVLDQKTAIESKTTRTAVSKESPRPRTEKPITEKPAAVKEATEKRPRPFDVHRKGHHGSAQSKAHKKG